jgi:hypothetical protein
MQYLKVITVLIIPFALLFADQEEKLPELEDVEILIKCRGIWSRGIFKLTYKKGDKKAKVVVDTTELEAEGEVDKDKVSKSLKRWEKRGLFKLKDQPRQRRCPKTHYSIEAKWGGKENEFEFWRHDHLDKKQEKYRRLVDHIIRFIERYALEDHEDEERDVKILIKRDGKESWRIMYKQGDKEATVVMNTTQLKKVDKDKLFGSLKRWKKMGLFALKDFPKPRCWTPIPILYTVEASWGKKENSFKFWVQGSYPFTRHRSLVATIIKFIEQHTKGVKE